MCPVMPELGDLALLTCTVEGSLSLFQTFPWNTKQEIHLSKWTKISIWFAQAQMIRSKRIFAHMLYSVSFPGSYQISGLHDYCFCLRTLHVPLSPLSSLMEVWRAPLTFANTSAAVMVPHDACSCKVGLTIKKKKKISINKHAEPFVPSSLLMSLKWLVKKSI